LDFLEVDNIKVTKQQLARLKSVKQNRNEAAVQESLTRLKNAAFRKMSQTEVAPDENLLALSIDAARKRATLGEISSAIEEVFGRYQAKNQSFTGVYSKAVKDDPFFKEARELLAVFEKKFGRNPRIMIAKMGQDGHDRGAKVIASAYADLGFDVDIGPLFQTPEEAAKQAVENDVHVLGVSSLAAGHKTLVPQLVHALAQHKREDISVIVGGVIPVQDHEFLIKSGVLGIYGPGTKISKAAVEILNLLLKKYTN
jgi:methylmalonyl-CoA mutase